MSKISKEVLIDLYCTQGMNQREIGEIFNCDRKLIDYYMKKHEIPKRTISEANALRNEKNRGLRITIKDILSKLDEGLLIGEIADYFGVSRSVLGRITKINNINLTNNKEQRKRQSERMKTNNPIPKKSKRPKEHMRGSHLANKINAENRWNNISSFKSYAKIARYIAYYFYGKGELIPEGMVIDHEFSVKDGFLNGIHVKDISNQCNLRLIPKKENLVKGAKSTITLEEFTLRIGVQRLSVTE